MNFAENNRISHRQLYRQIILTFLAPFLLCLFGERRIMGISGVLGVLIAAAVLAFYIIFLIRLAPYYGDLRKFAGKFWGRVAGSFFLSFVLLTAAYLLSLFEKIVPLALLQGFSGKAISFLVAVICGMGIHQGIQKRGRIAEVSGGLLLGAMILMMVLCLSQGRLDYLREMTESSVITVSSVMGCTYGMLCAFSGIGLLPFLLQDVEKQGSAGKTAILGILTLAGIVIGLLFLLPAVFGWERLQAESYPVLLLFAAANLPGNVLARFDVLWIGFLLYSLFFAVGSLFHYGYQIIKIAGLQKTKRIWWFPLAAYLLSVAEIGKWGIEDCYGKFLGYVFVPGMILVQIFLMMRGKMHHRKKLPIAAALLVVLFVFGGCSAVEPEKRMFPLAMGIRLNASEGTGTSQSEQFSLILGMPDLPKATGQEKPEEGASSSVLKLEGESFAVMKEKYNRSQEKYLDLGHLQVILVGKDVIQNSKWDVFLEYLKQEPLVGENVYLFCADDPEAILLWQGGGGTSIGEYLTGIMENRTKGQQNTGVTLRQVYHQWYQRRDFPKLPEVLLRNDQIEVLFE